MHTNTGTHAMMTKEEKANKKDKKRKRRKEEEEDGHDDAEEGRKLDKKLRKLLHLAPAKAQAQAQAPSIFPPLLVKAPPPPRLPPMAAAPPQAPHLPAFYKHVKDATIPTAPKPNVPIPSVRADAEELRRRQARAQRFTASSSLASSSSSSSSSAFLSQESKRRKDAKEKDHKRARPLVGTCVVVEKEYMRSMEEVDPATVRPPRVLREALQRVKAHWTANEDYEYACSQLKSIRQDLRVQHIEDVFTIHVYETHARIALEAGDLSEFLVAAARLDELRRLPISSSSSSSSSSSAAEFLAYRLLHALFLGHTAQIRLLLLQAREDEEMWNDPAVVHARAVLRAHAQGNYHRFFHIYNQAPHMSGYLMDFLLLRMRRLALPRVLAAYGPAFLPLLFLSQELGFDSEEECRQFVVEKEGWVVGRDGGREGGWVVDLRATRTRRRDGGEVEQEVGKAEEEEEERGKEGSKKKEKKKEKKREKGKKKESHHKKKLK